MHYAKKNGEMLILRQHYV